MKQVIIWGTGINFDKYIPLIKLEEMKGNLEICGVTAEEDHLQVVGGYLFIPKTKLRNIVFDYIIVTTVKFFGEICAEALNYGIKREQIIHPDVFMIPYFDFDRYIKILEGKISIISNHCWGGVVYKLLRMPFYSPFINTLIDDENYLRLVGDLPYYLKQELVEVKDSAKGRAPMGCLGDVEIQFIHHSSFGLAKKDWEKRINRVNYGNLFVEMTIGAKRDVIERFVGTDYSKKAAFCSIRFEDKNVVYLKDYEVDKFAVKYSYMFGVYVLDMVKPMRKISCPIDILKMLLGEDDFVMKK